MRLDLKAKFYGEKQVLGPSVIEVLRGRRVALLGPSGIGKTTILRILLGLDPQFEGSLTGHETRAPVFQEPVLLPWRNAVQNLVIASKVTAQEAGDWLARVGIGGHGANYPRQLSLGQQRRLSLARAFAMRPDILMMDEPFASLDADTARKMIALTSSMLDETGAGLVIVTHDPAEAEALGAEPLYLRGAPARLGGDDEVPQ